MLSKLQKVYFVLLISSLTLVHCFASDASQSKTHSKEEQNQENDLEDAVEFKNFCKNQREQTLQSQKGLYHGVLGAQDKCKVFAAGDFDSDNDMIMLFSLVIIILWGAIVRTILRYFHSSVPYTVVLMISGLLIGWVSISYCEFAYPFTAIARINPKIILFTFLPVLIFESAFSISAHTFMRSINQILIVALPGMIFSTVLTALVCMQFFTEYNWDFTASLLFGSIISATDPVAVVSILRELGVAESLSVMIEGESLLNDGVAILLYEIFVDILEDQIENENHKEQGEATEPDVAALALVVFKKFLQIAVGGPAFGFVMGKIAILSLSMVFNDATVEITVTLVAAYLTYYIGEGILGVSGVMAVVILGITMSAERTTISPDSEAAVHHFWEMLGYLANTVLFVLTGIIIVETALVSIDMSDVYYAIFLWFALNIIRFAMLLAFTPLLSRIGYGLPWQNMVVMMWGGLRGAVGICLSLEVYESEKFCHHDEIGPKMLFQTAGIVFLTLVVNGTTTKKLLQILKLTEISAGRLEEMANAVKQINDTQMRSLAMLKHDRFLADASWKNVEKFTTVVDPYLKCAEKLKKLDVVSSLISLRDYADHTTTCPQCNNLVLNDPSDAEYKEITEEARLRILKALKVSVWRQFEHGVLSEVAVQILSTAVEAAEDKNLYIVHAHELDKYMVIRGMLPKFRKIFVRKFGLDQEEPVPDAPKQNWRMNFWKVATHNSFDGIMMILVLINLIPVLWELSIEITFDSRNDKDEALEFIFSVVNIFFTIIYTAELLTKIIGRGCKDYFTNKWNYIDLIVLMTSYMDIALDTYSNEDHSSSNSREQNIRISLDKYLGVIKVFRLIRLFRSLRLIRPLVPLVLSGVNRRINIKLFLGYETGKGLLLALEDVIKLLPQMIENGTVLRKLKVSLEKERLIIIRMLGILQRDHPGISIGVKTRHAGRAVLNQMRESLDELKEDGLVDEKENQVLELMIEESIKRLWTSPLYIRPAPPENLLKKLSWVLGNDEIYEFTKERAQLKSFAYGNALYQIGDPPEGIYIIVSGMIKVHFVPTGTIIMERQEFGKMPNKETFEDINYTEREEEICSVGTVIGIVGSLTGQPRAASVVAETNVIAYHLSEDVIKEGYKRFNDPSDSLEMRLWRTCGLRRVVPILKHDLHFQSWALERIQGHVDRSVVPIGSNFDTFVIPSYVSETFVIEGFYKNYITGEKYTAPCIVPPSCSKLISQGNARTVNRLFVVVNENVTPEQLNGTNPAFDKLMQTASSLKPAAKDHDKYDRRQRHLSVIIGDMLTLKDADGSKTLQLKSDIAKMLIKKKVNLSKNMDED